ncbi:MAG TPA: BTAD domain-containing putative transcriptional regulator [Kineosporiaceae bacterium]|nr:BTAD domain-containing putative transcriptional regulator [Kineosporiaceae bacterium]
MGDLEQADDLAAAGDRTAAAALYERVRVAPGRGAAVAWRLGRLHYLHGDIDGALAALAADPARHESPDAVPPAPAGGAADDVALLLAWRATARWVRGDLEGCACDVDEALGLAVGDQALAAAHTARAMLAAARGDRRANEEAYEVALHHARRAGDDLQELRIRVNRGSRLVEEGDDARALEELDAALAGAADGRHPALVALALVNRGEALLRLGRPRDAVSDVAAARLLQPSPTSPAAAYALALLGDIHVSLDEAQLARQAYEEAVHTAAANGHAQALQLAVAGLTVLLADSGDLTTAQDLLVFGRGSQGQMAQVRFELAEATLAAVADPAGSPAAALRAVETALHRRDRHGLAHALELARGTRPRPAGRAPHPLGDARRTVRTHPAPRQPALAAGLPADPRAPTVAVRCLGAFEVRVGGVAVTARQWGVRRPQDLLKLLVVARGALPRDVAARRLWPGVPQQEGQTRLTAALTSLRRVLEQGREGTPAVVVGRTTLRLDRAVVDVDLDRFLDLARRAGDDGAALALAEECWTGEVLPDDLDVAWTAPARDEAREAYRGVLRRLAAHAAERGDHDLTARRCLRLLDLDPFDEDAHLTLVRALAVARRHGEARRRYEVYAARMGRLGLSASPLAVVLRPAGREAR